MIDLFVFNQILVYIALAFILLSLYLEWIGPTFTFLIAVSFLGLFNVLTPKEILTGFSNEQIIVIILLLLLGDIIQKAHVVDRVFNLVFKKVKGYRSFLAQMMALVAGFSAFLNNTPIVAVMMPYLHSWGKKNNVSVSKLMIPLSYAAILGGCATLIGTSTNLIVNGMVVDSGMDSLGLFDFTIIGLTMVVIGILYMIFFGSKFLPAKRNVIDDFMENSREYIIDAEIRKGSFLIGKTIEEAGLRNLQGLYLFEILRDDMVLSAVAPETILLEGDFLFFTGETTSVSDLIKPGSGLTLPNVGMLTRKKYTEVIEIVVSHNSTLINKTVKEANFRGKYDSAIIAIHRNGERLQGKLGEIRLKAGDVLLLLAGSDLTNRSADSYDFYFISKVSEFRKKEGYKIATLLIGTAVAIAISALGFISLFMALIILLIVLISIGMAHPKDLPKSIDYNLAMIIAMSLALGTAMINTGVAANISEVIIGVFKPLGILGLMFGLYFITTILAAYITNKASVAIIFPIAISLATDLECSPVPFILITAFASAANFMTPIGYQTNLMVYGPGGYAFKDYFKVGFPLTIIYMIASVLILYVMYF
ncbi:MAG: SLC13 family permease [Bacteroidales bacterium]|nr:SLC13 family permease [Bacteroidales bacterium]